MFVRVAIIETVGASQGDCHSDGVVNVRKLDLAGHSWVLVAYLSPLGENGTLCDDCLWGNDCLCCIGAKVACDVKVSAIVTCEGEDALLCAKIIQRRFAIEGDRDSKRCDVVDVSE